MKKKGKRGETSKWLLILLEDFLDPQKGFPRWMRKVWGFWVGWACEGCGREWGKGWLLECHHKTPLSAGGGNNFFNIRLLCLECHLRAHQQLAKQRIARGSLPLLKQRLRKTGGRWKRDKTLATYY